MINVWLIVQAVIALAIFLFTFGFLLTSIRENENRAAAVAGVLCGLQAVVALLVYYLYTLGSFAHFIGALLMAIVSMAVIGMIYFFWRQTDRNQRALAGTRGYVVGEALRYDEREQVFARERTLRPGSVEYKEFYRLHPELEPKDSERRKLGGLLGTPGAIDRPTEVFNISAMTAAFSIPPHFGKPQTHSPAVNTDADISLAMSPEEATRRIKGFARHLGAGVVGVAKMNPLWVYSKRGEIFYDDWDQWGEEIKVEHPYAIVFAVEMDLEMVHTAPHTASVAESALSYSKGAWISTQLAGYIANLGFSATANHSRHYDLLLVPAAVDAGLGEMGRFGYLITKELGPRVRLFAVTTDLPLVADTPVDIGVEDFCRFCKKCARCCPSNSIPDGEQHEVNGTLRWKLNAETCFGYWGKVGTDCNVCMRVCPWSHARTFPHRAVISMVVRNRWSRRLFSIMDDLFYGDKPKPGAPPPWAGYN
ncbi:MAG: reductive dehalogenase [Desulfobacterales bacterium]|jgi:reductive dehalogenase